LPIWIGGKTPGLAVRGGRRGAAGGLPPHRLVLIDGDLVGVFGSGVFGSGVFGSGVFGSGVFGSEQQSGVRHVDGLAL